MRTGRRYGAIGIVRHLVADQRAGIRGAIVRNRHSSIRRDYICVKIHQAFSADASTVGTHSMRRVASGATDSGIDVIVVMIPAGVLDDLV